MSCTGGLQLEEHSGSASGPPAASCCLQEKAQGSRLQQFGHSGLLGSQLPPAKSQEALVAVLGSVSSSGSRIPALNLSHASRCSGYICTVN